MLLEAAQAGHGSPLAAGEGSGSPQEAAPPPQAEALVTVPGLRDALRLGLELRQGPGADNQHWPDSTSLHLGARPDVHARAAMPGLLFNSTEAQNQSVPGGHRLRPAHNRAPPQRGTGWPAPSQHVHPSPVRDGCWPLRSALPPSAKLATQTVKRFPADHALGSLPWLSIHPNVRPITATPVSLLLPSPPQHHPTRTPCHQWQTQPAVAHTSVSLPAALSSFHSAICSSSRAHAAS